VQRYFSTFPGSWPGAGLLLLRVVAGGAAAIQGGVCLTHAAHPAYLWALALLAVAAGVTLVAGFMTPAAAAVAAIATIAMASVGSGAAPTGVFLDPAAAVFVATDAAALALLGPGAHSMDAYLFGRREIIFPGDRKW
jgi:hypothetical protein